MKREITTLLTLSFLKQHYCKDNIAYTNIIAFGDSAVMPGKRGRLDF